MAEARVKAFLLRRGSELLKERWQSPFGELDLLLRTPKAQLLMVEVKSLGEGQDPLQRVSPRQIQRLRRIHTYLCGKEDCLAYVFFVKWDGDLFWLGLEHF